jgi:hypothetical protein
MGQYEVRHQCDPKTCIHCGHYYVDSKSGCSCCDLEGHEDMAGRYAEVCKDFVNRNDICYKK